VSGTCGGRLAILRRAYNVSSSEVISWIAARVLSRCDDQRLPPNRCNRGGGESSEDVVGRSIALDLVDAVERNVEAVRPLRTR